MVESTARQIFENLRRRRDGKEVIPYPPHPTIDRPDWDTTWMEVAIVISMRSRCSRARIGAVIVGKDQRPVAVGYNGPPATYEVKDESPNFSCKEFCERSLKEVVGQSYGDCPSVHAEMNAVAFADRSSMLGSTIYVTSAPCWDCAKVIANSGITFVVYQDKSDVEHRRTDEVTKLFEQCKIDWRVFRTR